MPEGAGPESTEPQGRAVFSLTPDRHRLRALQAGREPGSAFGSGPPRRTRRRQRSSPSPLSHTLRLQVQPVEVGEVDGVVEAVRDASPPPRSGNNTGGWEW